MQAPTHYRELLTLFKVLDVAAGERNADLVDFGTRHLGTCGIVFFFSFGDVTHFECRYESEGDFKRGYQWKSKTKG